MFNEMESTVITQLARSYALLVGVDNYRAHASNGRMDLPGSVNDVVAWRNTLLRRGFHAEDIRVLVSATSGASSAAAATIPGTKPATRENIQRGLEWLAGRLNDSPHSAGVFTFSGHGDLDRDGAPVICPTDTAGDDAELEHVIPLAEMIYELPRNATVVLDCCHSGAPGAPAAVRDDANEAIKETVELPAGAAVVLSLRRREAASLKEDIYRVRMPAARIFSATSLTGVAFQTEVSGRYQGALTWALTSLLGQWRVLRGAPSSVSLSCRTAHARVESLFAALGLPQSATLHGASVMDPNLARRVPMLGRGSEGLVSEPPDGVRVPLQFPVDLKVWVGTDIHGPQGRDCGVISALGHAPPAGFERNKEYWRLGDKLLEDLAKGAKKLVFAVDTTSAPPRWDDITTDPPHPLFWMDLVPEWKDSAPPAGKGYYSNDSGAPVAVFIELVAPSSPTAQWSGKITWYRVLPAGADVSTPVFGAKGRTLELLDAPPVIATTQRWQRVELAPHQV